MENLTISQNTIGLLNEFIKTEDIDIAIHTLVYRYSMSKIEHYKMIDRIFQERKGMTFQEYHDTKYDEWDGDDWTKIEEFHQWEDSITGIQYYMDIIKKWKLKNLETNLSKV